MARQSPAYIKISNEIKKITKSYEKSPQPEKLTKLAELFFKIAQFDDAIACLQAAIKAAPDNSRNFKLLGDCFVLKKQPGQAMEFYQRAMIINKDDDDAWGAAGNLMLSQKRYEEAARYFSQALDLKDSADNNNNIGVLIYEKGLYREASNYFLRAVSLDRKNPNHKKNLARTLFRLGKYKETLIALHEAYHDGEDQMYFKAEMGNVIRHIAPMDFSPEIKEITLLCLRSDNIDHKNFSTVWVSNLVLDPANRGLFSHTNHESYDEFKAAFKLGDHLNVLADEFTLLGLRLVTLQALETERLFTRIRRFILEHVLQDDLAAICATDKERDKLLLFVLALSEAGFMSEYAFLETAEEEGMIEQLRSLITEPSKQCEPNALALQIALLGAYRPLWLEQPSIIKQAKDLKLKNNKAWESCLKLCILEPEEERALRSTIPAIGSISDEVSAKVREQYEESPYPRWRYTNVQIDPKKPFEFNKPYKILIAGCGTGKQVLQDYTMYPNAEITAVDLSLSSICYAKRKVQELGIKNVKFFHADILDLGVLEEKFDFVMCSGVLHHMKEPEKGLAVLTKLLKPDGMMDIGLYSEFARQRVVHFRDFVKQKAWNSDLKGIRSFREHVMNLANDDPLKLIARSRDFFSVSMCRDLIFHVQEHRFTLAELDKVLKRHDLSFVTFSYLPPSIINDFKLSHPAQEDYYDLLKWHEYEEKNPDIFAAMYQIWLCPSGNLAKVRSEPKRINALFM